MSRTDIDLLEVADLLPGAILLVEPDGRLVAANQRGRALLGITTTDGAGLQLSEKLMESDEQFRGYLTLCARSRQPMPGRITIRQSGEEPRSFAVSGGRVGLDENRRLVLLYCDDVNSASPHRRFVTLNETIEQLKQEVQSRRRAEALVEAEKKVLSRIVNGAPLEQALDTLTRALEEHTAGMFVSILLLDEESRLRHAAAPSLPARYTAAIDGVAIGPNVGSCGTAAYSGETVVATDIATDPRWVDYKEAALRDGLRACWSTPIRSSAGKVLGTLALYYSSVREPTESELLLIDNSAHIAAIAIERHRSEKALTELLAREQSERERAEAENRAKDQFLAILSHELRNPLSAVANAAYALDAFGDADAERARLQEIVIEQGKLLRRILDDLLDISRLNTGKMGLQIESVDVADVMTELRDAIHTSYPDRPIEFRCADDIGFIQGDRARVLQMLMNLMDNAFKHSTKDDAVSVAVTGDEQGIRIAIRDSGEGIDPGILPKIFDPFIQADESLARSGSGLGLGLALVQRFAEMHGGSITARSEGPGRGSEFVLRLPRGRVAAQHEPRARAEAAAARSRVLVVEDNEDAREGLCRLLELWGHEVRAAGDGEEALDLVREEPPDVALVDIGLPTLDGYELAKAIRSDHASAKVKLVALTGYGQKKDKERAADAGFEVHLVKPVDVAELSRIFGKPDASGDI